MAARFARIILCALAIGLNAAYDVSARDDLPLTYTRTRFVIMPKQAAPTSAAVQEAPSLPWQKKETQPPAAPPKAQGILFDAELRDAATLFTQGWFNLSGLSGNQALMLMLKDPAIAAIRPAGDYAPYDILLVADDGRIFQILPSLVLADLQEAYQTPQAVAAIIYLRGGTCEQLGISPGDKVVNKHFKVRPKILDDAKTDEAPATTPGLKVRPAAEREAQWDEMMRQIMRQSQEGAPAQ